MDQPFMVLCREIDGNYNYRAEFYVHTLIRKASQLARAYYTSTTNAEGGGASAQRRAENVNRKVIRSERQVILAALRHLVSKTYKRRHSAEDKHTANEEGQMKDVLDEMLKNPSWGYDKFQDLLRNNPEASKWFKTLSTRTRAMSTGDRAACVSRTRRGEGLRTSREGGSGASCPSLVRASAWCSSGDHARGGAGFGDGSRSRGSRVLVSDGVSFTVSSAAPATPRTSSTGVRTNTGASVVGAAFGASALGVSSAFAASRRRTSKKGSNRAAYMDNAHNTEASEREAA